MHLQLVPGHPPSLTLFDCVSRACAPSTSTIQLEPVRKCCSGPPQLSVGLFMQHWVHKKHITCGLSHLNHQGTSICTPVDLNKPSHSPVSGVLYTAMHMLPHCNPAPLWKMWWSRPLQLPPACCSSSWGCGPSLCLSLIAWPAPLPFHCLPVPCPLHELLYLSWNSGQHGTRILHLHEFSARDGLY